MECFKIPLHTFKNYCSIDFVAVEILAVFAGFHYQLSPSPIFLNRNNKLMIAAIISSIKIIKLTTDCGSFFINLITRTAAIMATATMLNHIVEAFICSSTSPYFLDQEYNSKYMEGLI